MIYDFIIFTPFRYGGRKLGAYRIASLLREQGLKVKVIDFWDSLVQLEPLNCLLYTSPSPRDGLLSRMPSSA